jgi:RND family efflux transporter MFP subunit
MKAETMKATKTNVVASTLILAAALSGCGQSNSKDSEVGIPKTEAPMEVRIEEIRPVPFSETLLLTGYVKSLDDVVVSTEEGGVLREWAVRRGAYVRKGELLASMKDDVLRPQYEAALAQYEIAELTYQKQKKVFEEQGISEVQVLTAQYNRDAARAQMELAKNRLERTSIKSPIDGILDDRLIDEGELAPPGAPVARVVNIYSTNILLMVP